MQVNVITKSIAKQVNIHLTKLDSDILAKFGITQSVIILLFVNCLLIRGFN